MDWSAGQARPQLYTLEAVWEMFGWSRNTFYRLVREGRFPRPRWMGDAWKYTQEDLAAYVVLAGRWEPGPFDPEAGPGAKSPGKPPRKSEDATLEAES